MWNGMQSTAKTIPLLHPDRVNQCGGEEIYYEDIKVQKICHFAGQLRKEI